MSLNAHLNDVLEVLLVEHSSTSVTRDQLIQCIDLTLLEEHSPIESLSQLHNQAKTNKVAAICVYSDKLNYFRTSDEINLATVINFPHGNNEIQISMVDTDQAIELGAKEIDYVFDYHSYQQGDKQKTLGHCRMITELCKNHHVALKIILETGAFTELNTIYQLSKELIDIGCNFLKTSTGKIAQGASLPAALAILSAIKESGSHCGIKISGGIKTPQQALSYATLAELMLHKKINKEWFRIGASSLLGELLKG